MRPCGYELALYIVPQHSGLASVRTVSCGSDHASRGSTRAIQRLVAAGKPEKVARCAAARKVLRIAWAVARKGESFDPHYAQRRR